MYVCLRSRSLCRQTIGKGGTVAAYVAETGQRLFVKDILGVNCGQPLILLLRVFLSTVLNGDMFLFLRLSHHRFWKIISRLCCFRYLNFLENRDWITSDFELLLRRMKDSLKELASKVRTTLQNSWRKVNHWTVFYDWWPYKDSKSGSLRVLLSKVGAWKVNLFIRNKYYTYQHTINPYKKTGGSLCVTDICTFKRAAKGVLHLRLIVARKVYSKEIKPSA